MEVLLSSLAVQDSETARSYLSHLTALSQMQLAKQAGLLAAEEHSLDASLKALAVREAASFSPAQSQVLSVLPDLTRSLESFRAKLPKLEQAAMFDAERLAGIHQVRKEAALLERNESRLQELLDLPATVRQCVSQGYYAEAADLYLHLGRIASRHPNSRLVKSLVVRAEEEMERMTLQLLGLLNRPQKLPVALKVIGLLRRTGSFEEAELRYLFLKGRYDALVAAYAAVPTSPVERSIKKQVEIFREQAFAILSQYSSIFDDKAADDFSHNWLPHFAQRIVTDLLQRLSDALPHVEGKVARQSLLTQLLYTAQSMARVGCDFTSMLLPHFGSSEEVYPVVANQRAMARKLEP
ncbi:oligomeric Golgi complex subunit 8 [Protomyces lactucae-debilis]|uniref:Conserved oligomeric Golgi complex subunit 8 n=1 Tax=Protomyces lactucae-debilis TaxID=2754530 RepID=A0A1Y2EVB5_PROLT|nr:oligomeric Golgi complex subunit 8 [Protomyces lactucae-debilis]ORY75086.1 oligomeric Golgi complex subunit 8 [Protomyces lactucae-debilis]